MGHSPYRFLGNSWHSSPLCDILSGCCFFTGLWTVTRSSLCVLRRVLTAAAACVPCGVGSASAEPSSWHTGAVLVVAEVVLRFLLPTPLHVQVVHHMGRHVSVCVRPNCSTPPCIVLVVHHLPSHAAVCVGPNYSISACVHLYGGLGGLHCTVASLWSLVCPTSVLSRARSLSSTIPRTGQTALQGSLQWASGHGVPCAHKILRTGQTVCNPPPLPARWGPLCTLKTKVLPCPWQGRGGGGRGGSCRENWHFGLTNPLTNALDLQPGGGGVQGVWGGGGGGGEALRNALTLTAL